MILRALGVLLLAALCGASNDLDQVMALLAMRRQLYGAWPGG